MTGVLSLDSSICCASFCGECGDYPTCSSVRGQNSTTQCCKSQVAAHECGTEGVSANACLKKCSRAPPPCIMDFEVTVPDTSTMVTAAEDCGEARKDWRMRAAAIVGDQAAMDAQAAIDGGKYRVPASQIVNAPDNVQIGVLPGSNYYYYYYYYYYYNSDNYPWVLKAENKDNAKADSKAMHSSKHMGKHEHKHMGMGKNMGKGHAMGMGKNHDKHGMGMGKHQ